MIDINPEGYKSNNVLSIEELIPIIEQLKRQNKKIGFCSGGFDLLHPGHLTHLESAKRLCDILVVGVALDDTVKSRRPEPGRPVFSHHIRAFMISRLKPVDFVVIEPMASVTMRLLKPDIFIKGIDYSHKSGDSNLEQEKSLVESLGGKMAFTSNEKLSTTDIFQYVKERITPKIKIPEEYKYISAFLTMRCNLNCSFCINSFDKSKEFNRTKFKEISGDAWVRALNRIDSRADLPISFSGGEPFLHPDFIYIINHLKPELRIDILTNLQWGDSGIKRFIEEVKPERINRDSPYPSIRVSYHPEQMQNGENLVKNVKKIRDAGFSIGIYSVLHPSPKQLQAINEMQFRCLEEGILFRLKEFLGEYKGELYGNYTKYPEAVNSSELKNCLCKTSELLISPDGKIYRCHRDLYHEENPVGDLADPNFQIEDKFKICSKFGECNPCDVKVKTDYKQKLGHTSVEIKDAD